MMAPMTAPQLPLFYWDFFKPISFQQTGRQVNTQSLPGGKISHRPVRFFFLLDCSGSMTVAGKIDSLNQAIREAIAPMREVAAKNPTAELQVQVIKFADTATWHIANPTPIEKFQWQSIEAYRDQRTAMGAAFRLVAEQLRMPPMPERSLPPVLCLISDGQPTDDYRSGLKLMQSTPWYKRALRTGIGIGSDADLDVLREFIDNPEIPVLVALTSNQLADFILWTTVTLTQSVMMPPTQATGSQGGTNVFIPKPPSPPIVGPIPPW